MHLRHRTWETLRIDLSARMRIIERISIALDLLGISDFGRHAERPSRSLEWRAWLARRLLNTAMRLLDEITSEAHIIIDPKLRSFISRTQTAGVVDEDAKTGIIDFGEHGGLSPVIRLFHGILNSAFSARAELIVFERTLGPQPSFHAYHVVAGNQEGEQPLPTLLWEPLMEALHFHCLPVATEPHQPHGSFTLRFDEMHVRCTAAFFPSTDPHEANLANVGLTYLP
ncbi:MAG: hypothetical protein Q8P82_03285 [bacterium]|nr:hypothetical protein [bacterium]